MSKDLTGDIVDPAPDGPIKKTIASLIAEMHQSEQPKTYTVRVYDCDLRFRYPSSTSEVDNFPGLARAFMLKMKARVGLPAPFINALSIRDMEPADYINAYALTYWSDPNQEGGKINEVQALEMVGLRPGICSGIMMVIESAMVDGAVLSVANDVEAKKNGSGKTTNIDSDLKQASPIIEKLPTG